MSEPAFPPNAGWRDNIPECRGLSKREWFAGMALAGLHANPDAGSIRDRVHAAVLCFAMADAMLAASKEPKP